MGTVKILLIAPLKEFNIHSGRDEETHNRDIELPLFHAISSRRDAELVAWLNKTVFGVTSYYKNRSLENCQFWGTCKIW